MSRSIDMSLDEIIRRNQRSGGHVGHLRGKGQSSGAGPERRAPRRDLTRTAPYTMKQPMQVNREAITGQQSMMPRAGIRAETEKRIYISNLDYGVSDEDIELLFSDVGQLKSYSIHYDRNGRSKGTAEVVYFRQIDALAAIRRFNNMRLDGRPLKIELVGVQLVASDSVPPTSSCILENSRGGFRSGQEREDAKGSVHGGGGRGSARVRRQGNFHGNKLPADLDAELDEYHADARRKKMLSLCSS